VLATGVLVVAACGGGDDGALDTGAPLTAPSTLEPASDDGCAPASTTGPPVTDAPDVDRTGDPTTSLPAGDSGDSGDSGDAGDAGDEPTDPTTPTAAPEVPEILQVTAPVVGGGEIDLAAYGDRPLLLWFWAPF
jgi:hypothetical protein